MERYIKEFSVSVAIKSYMKNIFKNFQQYNYIVKLHMFLFTFLM